MSLFHCLLVTSAFISTLVSVKAFDVVEKSYFETIDDALAEKANLQTQLPEVTAHTRQARSAFLLMQTFCSPHHVPVCLSVRVSFSQLRLRRCQKDSSL